MQPACLFQARCDEGKSHKYRGILKFDKKQIQSGKTLQHRTGIFIFMENITNVVFTIYGYVEGKYAIEVPSGRKYVTKSNYIKSKPTWINLGLDWFDGRHDVVDLFNFEKEV